MGKRGKDFGKQKQQPEPSSQEEEEEEDNEQEIQEIEDDEQSQDDSAVVMEKIHQKIDQVQDGQKLSWAALVTLHNQKKNLIQAMDKQIEEIQKKYHDLQVPIVEKISKAIAGEALQKTLYENEKTKNINVNKVKPKPIEDYWLNIIEKSRLSGLMAHQQDRQILKKCTKIVSTIHDNGEQTHLTFTMHFAENPYFKNPILELQLKQQGDALTRKVTYPIEYKTEKRDQSFFTFIFQHDNLDDMVLQMLLDFHNSYMNSLKVYFLGQTDFSEKQELGEEDDEQDQQSQQFEGKKPNKKLKGGQGLQKKPQCNQQ